MPETEADTCRVYVLPKLYAATWTDDQIQEQHSFTDGWIVQDSENRSVCLLLAEKGERRRKLN